MKTTKAIAPTSSGRPVSTGSRPIGKRMEFCHSDAFQRKIATNTAQIVAADHFVRRSMNGEKGGRPM
jgi:hypothetical protein